MRPGTPEGDAVRRVQVNTRPASWPSVPLVEVREA